MATVDLGSSGEYLKGNVIANLNIIMIIITAIIRVMRRIYHVIYTIFKYIYIVLRYIHRQKFVRSCITSIYR